MEAELLLAGVGLAALLALLIIFFLILLQLILDWTERSQREKAHASMLAEIRDNDLTRDVITGTEWNQREDEQPTSPRREEQPPPGK